MTSFAYLIDKVVLAGRVDRSKGIRQILVLVAAAFLARAQTMPSDGAAASARAVVSGP
jgi:hypothetical protein